MAHRFSALSSLVLVAAACAAGAGASCASKAPSSGVDGDRPPPSGPYAAGPDSGSGAGFAGEHDVYSDFPAQPIVAPGLPAGIADLFTNAPGTASGGPCLAEPTLDAMVPRNWTPLVFEWTPGEGQNVFELRVSVKNQTRDLVVYATDPSFTIDRATWQSLTAHSAGNDLQISVRGAVLSGATLAAGPFTGSAGLVHLAPVEAPGSVVYWTSSADTAFLGFRVGDPSPTPVLTPATAGTASGGGKTACVSCHTSSPDGKLVLYTRDADDGTRALDARRVDDGAVPATPQISDQARALLGRDRQFAPVLSPAHYSASDAVVVSVLQDPGTKRYELAWTDLHATSPSGSGILARTGDPGQVASPTWRHDGAAIAYVSAPATGEGVIADGGDFNIYTVPYANRAGGAATPLPGASDPTFREFYPVYSPEDALLAFNRTREAVNSYDQPSAELAVVPANGGSARRLRANDPPACTGRTSPGLTNSWARWAPTAVSSGDKRYYWLVFSSKRRPGSQSNGKLRPQLYVSAVVTTGTGANETVEQDYPALYVGSQRPDESNHTPAWDLFEVRSTPR